MGWDCRSIGKQLEESPVSNSQKSNGHQELQQAYYWGQGHQMMKVTSGYAQFDQGLLLDLQPQIVDM